MASFSQTTMDMFAEKVPVMEPPEQHGVAEETVDDTKNRQLEVEKKPSFVFVQWNQKDLTLLEERADGYPQSIERVKKLGDTIKDMDGGKNTVIGMCVEEIRTGGGGLALQWIADYLNKNCKTHKTWKFKTSGEVNPQGRRRELMPSCGEPASWAICSKTEQTTDTAL